MRPALGPSFVRPVSIGVLLSEADTEHIRREAQKFRPPERCFKDIAGYSLENTNIVFSFSVMQQSAAEKDRGRSGKIENNSQSRLFFMLLCRLLEDQKGHFERK